MVAKESSGVLKLLVSSRLMKEVEECKVSRKLKAQVLRPLVVLDEESRQGIPENKKFGAPAQHVGSNDALASTSAPMSYALLMHKITFSINRNLSPFLSLKYPRKNSQKNKNKKKPSINSFKCNTKSRIMWRIDYEAFNLQIAIVSPVGVVWCGSGTSHSCPPSSNEPFSTLFIFLPNPLPFYGHIKPV
ncbi:hypothetical protein GOBAR_DD24499 [Gossypium barbadense]|nr:hypothetical protein GOBAR_DD24499 [Gossypium barbadense]